MEKEIKESPTHACTGKHINRNMIMGTVVMGTVMKLKKKTKSKPLTKHLVK